MRRFASLIDRHENFYDTYSSLDPNSANISQQPSPLVACSITLTAANQWAYTGTADNSKAGFIFLTRIPFSQILSGDIRSIDTLGRLKDGNGDGQPDNDLKAGPNVLRVQDIYAGKATLDMSKVWVDIATLSHNQYQGEHEISKYGTVPAEQIEGLLVVGNPVNLAVTPEPTP